MVLKCTTDLPILMGIDTPGSLLPISTSVENYREMTFTFEEKNMNQSQYIVNISYLVFNNIHDNSAQNHQKIRKIQCLKGSWGKKK